MQVLAGAAAPISSKRAPSFVQQLETLRELIRIGWPIRDGAPLSAKPAADVLGDTIESHIERLRPRIREAALHERLRFHTLAAEFEYAFGRRAHAAASLAGLVHECGLERAFRQWQTGEKKPFRHVADSPEFLRDKIRALMAVAFYAEYAVGNVRTATSRLQALLTITNKELLSHTRRVSNDALYEPFGTRAQLHLMLAQGYRTLRDFPRAEAHFHDAQVQSQRRLERELCVAETLDEEPRRERRLREIQFANVVTARVIGGRGRLAMLEGRLLPARQQLRSAMTLLVPSGQVALKRVIASLIAITDRRLARPGSGGWNEAMSVLEDMYETCVKDHDGRRRCAQELARAYIEQAEECTEETSRTRALHLARHWINELRALATLNNTEGGHPERFRADLLDAEWHILRQPRELAPARASLVAAMDIFDRRKLRFCGLDLACFDHVTPDRVSCLLAAADAAARRGSDGEAQANGRAILEYYKLQSEARQANDRVLESEAGLRMALAQLAADLPDDAERSLVPWRHYGRFVENFYLHALFRRAVKDLQAPFKLPRCVTLAEAIDLLQEHLCHQELLRAGTKKEAMAALRTTAPIFDAAIERLKRKTGRE